MKDKHVTLSAILIVKNEENKLTSCLESLGWVDEIICVDNDSTDNSIKIAKKFNCSIFGFKGGTFSERKNFGAEKATSEWLLFIDADEQVTPALCDEINTQVLMSGNSHFVYAIPRRNVILGKEFKYSGQWPDYVIRLLRKDHFIKWIGDLHEQPKYKGSLGYLKNPFIHIKHANLHEMVGKTNVWSEVEAKLMFEAHHPPMNIFRFLSAVVREFWLRFAKEKAFLDGSEGVIYGSYQIFSRFLSYAKLWEMQLMTKDLRQ